ncbi:MAG TPA: hypothetical protein VGM96_09810, partial [Reyranella sp.]
MSRAPQQAGPDARLLQAQIATLSLLAQLTHRARHAATIEELAFLAVNETHALVPYRQAALWRRDAAGAGRVLAVSGAPMIERDAPFPIWLERLMAALDRRRKTVGALTVIASDLPADLAADWGEWLPTHALLMPLSGGGEVRGALLLARDPPWQEGDARLLGEVIDAYGHAWAALDRRRRLRPWRALLRRDRWVAVAVAVLVFAVMWIPVRQSALAPAEIVPLEPTVV